VSAANFSGAVFTTGEANKFARFIPFAVCPGDSVIARVTYIGRNEHGCSFFGALGGTVVEI